jgi:hypothetical protein
MAMGYGGTHGDGQHLGGSGDGGFDGVINQDPLGLGRVYVQAKRYAPDNIVGLSKASSAASMRRARAKGRVGRPKALTPQAQKAVVDLRNQGKAIAENSRYLARQSGRPLPSGRPRQHWRTPSGQPRRCACHTARTFRAVLGRGRPHHRVTGTGSPTGTPGAQRARP